MNQEDTTQYRSPNRMHDRRFFYKYVTTNTAKIILATEKLRWSSPIIFDDFYDVPEELPLIFSAEECMALYAEKYIS